DDAGGTGRAAGAPGSAAGRRQRPAGVAGVRDATAAVLTAATPTTAPGPVLGALVAAGRSARESRTAPRVRERHGTARTDGGTEAAGGRAARAVPRPRGASRTDDGRRARGA